MADPVTLTAALTAVGTSATVAGGVIGAGGAAKAGAAAEVQGYYQAGIAELNRTIALQNADYAMNAGEAQAQQYGIQERNRMGQITAAQASSGLDIHGQSATAVRAGQRQLGSIDVAQIRTNAWKQAYNFDVEAAQFGKQAELYRMGGVNAAEAGQIKAETSIIGAAGSVADKWSQGSQVGLLSSGLGSVKSGIAGILGSGGSPDFSIGSIY